MRSVPAFKTNSPCCAPLHLAVQLVAMLEKQSCLVPEWLPGFEKGHWAWCPGLRGQKTQCLNSTLAEMNIISMCIFEAIMESFPIYLYCQTELCKIKIQCVAVDC